MRRVRGKGRVGRNEKEMFILKITISCCGKRTDRGTVGICRKCFGLIIDDGWDRLYDEQEKEQLHDDVALAPTPTPNCSIC